MAATTLTQADATETFTLTAGALYVMGASGEFGSGLLRLEYALAGTPAVFESLPGGLHYRETALELRSPGTRLRVSVENATALTSVNFEITAAA